MATLADGAGISHDFALRTPSCIESLDVVDEVPDSVVTPFAMER